MTIRTWSFAVALVLVSGHFAGLRAQEPAAAPASQETRPASRPGDFTSAGMTARLRALLPDIEAVLGETTDVVIDLEKAE